MPWPPCDLPPAIFAYGAWTGRTRTRARPGARARARAPPPLSWHRRRHHGLSSRRRWYRQAALVFPTPQQRRGWASAVFTLAPPRGAAPRGCAPLGPPCRGVERVVAHPPSARGQPGLAVCRPAPRRLRVQDQGGHCAPSPGLQVPQGPLRARPPAGRPQSAPPLDIALVPSAHVAQGDGPSAVAAPRHGRVGIWDNPPMPAGTSAQSAASPSSGGRRLLASPTPWGWTSGAGCGTTTVPARPPPLTLRLRQRGWTWPRRCVPTSPWSPTCGGQPCRNRGEIHATSR